MGQLPVVLLISMSSVGIVYMSSMVEQERIVTFSCDCSVVSILCCSLISRFFRRMYDDFGITAFKQSRHRFL